MVSRATAGTALVAAGVLLVVLSFTVSAVLAPSIGTTHDAPTGGDAPRRTLVGSQGGGPGLHEDGSVYLLTGERTTWKEASADSYFDVTQLDDGRVMAGFMDGGYSECGPYESPCVHTGYRIIDPDAEGGPKVVDEWGYPVRTRKNSETHDVELLPTGEYLLTDMEYESIFTVRDGEVTWRWNASSMYDAPPDPTKTDWLHINDVDRIGDGRFLVSVRNANQLVVVQRGEGVVEVINADENGDGRGDPSVLKRQHNPQWLNNDTVLVADSENDRIVELHRNADGEWTPRWTLRQAGGVGFSWPRDADRLPNGDTLITDSANQRIVEVNESGDVVWSHKTPYIPYEAERLPYGELVGGPAHGEAPTNGTATPTPDAGGDVPVLSFLLQAARTSFPLPYWLSEWHVFVTLLSLGMVIAGGYLRLRAT